MKSTRVGVDASPSIRFPTWNLVLGIYLEIGPWKFNPLSGPPRQIIIARSMPNTVGSLHPCETGKRVKTGDLKVLLTGANGYVGLRLLPELLEAGHEVVCLVRDRRRFPSGDFTGERMSIVEGDLLEPESLRELPEDLEAAYYLVHSMGAGTARFQELEARAAETFRKAMGRTGVRQIIYLSGIVPEGADEALSPHLRSRLEVERILGAGGIPLTTLRAPIIVGSGSASFEIIRDLVEKLPVMVAPKWLKTRCQPIAIRNVTAYLLGVLDLEAAKGESFEIGGPEVLSYREMLLRYAKRRDLKRWILTVPVMTPRLSSYWLFLVTSTSFPLAQALVESMKHEVVCREERIRELVGQELLSYEEAIDRAFTKVAQNRVPSTWFDALASGRLESKLLRQIKPPEFGVLRDDRSFEIADSEEECLRRIWGLGGKAGWYSLDWAWALRGWVDRLVGGTGLRRGRRSPVELCSGDALDFWRVLVADREEGRLLLLAEMKLPGEAWLEWRVEGDELRQTATFRPSGLLGRLYWMAVLPFHHLIFRGLGRVLSGQKEMRRRE